MDSDNNAVKGVQHQLAVAEQAAEECLSVLKYSKGLVQHDIGLVRSQLELMLRTLETKANEHLQKLVTQTEHAVHNAIKDMKHIVESIGTRSSDQHTIETCHTLLGQKMALIQKKRLTFKANETLSAVLAQINSIGYIEIHELDTNEKRNSTGHIESADMSKNDHRNCIVNQESSIIENKSKRDNFDNVDSQHFAYRSQRKRIDDRQAVSHDLGTRSLQNKHGDHTVTKPKFSNFEDKTSHDWLAKNEEKDMLLVNEFYPDVNPLAVLRSMQGHTITHSNDTPYNEYNYAHYYDLKFTRKSLMDMKSRRQDSNAHAYGVIKDDNEPDYLKKTPDIRRKSDLVNNYLSPSSEISAPEYEIVKKKIHCRNRLSACDTEKKQTSNTNTVGPVESDYRGSTPGIQDANTLLINHEYSNDKPQNNTELQERKSFDYEVQRGRYLRNKLKYRRARSVSPMSRWADTNGDVDSERTRCSETIESIVKTPSQNVQHTPKRRVLNNTRDIKLEDNNMQHHKHNDNGLHHTNKFTFTTQYDHVNMDVAERNECGYGNALKTNIDKNTIGIIKNSNTNGYASKDAVLNDNEGERHIKDSEFKQFNSSKRKSLSISEKRRRNRSVPVDIGLFLKSISKETSLDVVETCLDKEHNNSSSLLTNTEKLSAEDTRVSTGLCYTDRNTIRANNNSNSNSDIAYVTMHKRKDARKPLKSRLPSFSDMLYSGQ